MHPLFIVFAVSVSVLFVPIPASAQNVYLLDGGAFSNALAATTLAERTRALIGGTVKPNAKKEPLSPPTQKGSDASIRFVSTPAASAIPSIASYYPAERRREVRGTLTLLLPKFAAVEAMYGQPRHDLATAISAFIGASYEAVSGKEITYAQGAALIKQMRNVLISDSTLVNSSAAEKQKLYEQFAIFSMMLAGARLESKQHSNVLLAEKASIAGRAYLSQFSLNPDKMRFTDKGLIQY